MADTDAGEELSMSLLEQLECPVCFEYCTPPIFMCPNGHNVCNQCVNRLESCAICKGPKPSIRNLFSEAMSAKVAVACQNSQHGCQERCSLVNLKKHSESCQFTVRCRIRLTADGTVKCPWIGNTKKDMKLHVLVCHPEHYHDGKVAKMNSNFNTRATYVNVKLFCTLGEFFWVFFHYIPATNSMYPYVRYDGDGEMAGNFTCHFNFAKRTLKRKIVYQSQCICLHDVTSVVEDVSLPFHVAILRNFTSEGYLQCEVQITKDSQPIPLSTHDKQTDNLTIPA